MNIHASSMNPVATTGFDKNMDNLCHKYRELWLWTGKNQDQLDLDAKVPNRKWDELLAVEAKLLEILTPKQLALIRSEQPL